MTSQLAYLMGQIFGVLHFQDWPRTKIVALLDSQGNHTNQLKITRDDKVYILTVEEKKDL